MFVYVSLLFFTLYLLFLTFLYFSLVEPPSRTTSGAGRTTLGAGRTTSGRTSRTAQSNLPGSRSNHFGSRSNHFRSNQRSLYLAILLTRLNRWAIFPCGTLAPTFGADQILPRLLKAPAARTPDFNLFFVCRPGPYVYLWEQQKHNFL